MYIQINGSTFRVLNVYVKLCIEKDLDGLEFQLINLWRSTSWKRLDSLYNEGWFVKLWRVKSDMSFDVSKQGLHQTCFPKSVKKTLKQNDLKIIHYGFSDDINLAHKYLTYKYHGQRGYNMLDRLLDENQLILEEVSSSLFPVGLYHNSSKPRKRSFVEALEVVESLKCKVERPKYSIACLIYKSVEWLDFVYKQLLKYTDFKDVEFYFIANDASENVIKYLKNNHIPHYIHQNSKSNKDEWYINNVYRAYNYAAHVAKGDFVVLINSDMSFSPGWLEALIAAYDGNNVISSRLVESGKLPSGLYGIEKNFGKHISDYKEKKFLKFANSISKKKIVESGLYMPLLFRKDHFSKVNGYPEGNLKKNANIFSNDIASRNDEQVPGDTVFIEKLKTIGIKHMTAFNSIVYHFQNGEQDSEDKITINTYLKNIAVCGDLSLKTFENKLLAHYLVGNVPGTYLIDAKLLRTNHSKEKINRIIKNNYPKTSIIIKNATSSNFINRELYTICFIEDDLRKAGKRNAIQEINLKYSNKRVTNSIEIAISYAEYDFEIIPNLSLEKWKKLIEKSSIEVAQLQTRIIKPVISREDFLLFYENLCSKFECLLINYLLGEKYWVIKKFFTREGIKHFIKRILTFFGLLKYIRIIKK